MMRTWKMLGLKAFLAAFLAATAAPGSNASGPQSDGEKPEDIQKQLTALKNSLAEVKKTLEDIRIESTAGAQKAQSQISDLSKQISQLRQEVDNLRTVTSSASRAAMYPPPETGLSAGSGRVEMINTYSQAVSIVLNNRRSYFLAPGQRRLSDPIPAGPFTYEVLGVTPAVTRTVAADKTFTIWVHPQM